MKDPIIVYARGLWSHQDAVNWIIQKTAEATGLEVIDFDYSEELVQDVSNKTYLNRAKEKYGDEVIAKNRDIIYMGHSHGAALGIVFNKMCVSKKMILSAPGIRPFGVVRRIPNALKKDYVPHYVIKNSNEVSTRMEYFKENFNLIRDFSRVFYVGTEAKKSIDSIKSDTLFIQGTKDEFVNVGTNLKLFDKIKLPTYQQEISTEGPHKQIIIIPGGEHAIFEEVKNKGKDNEEAIYETLFAEVENFTRR